MTFTAMKPSVSFESSKAVVAVSKIVFTFLTF